MNEFVMDSFNRDDILYCCNNATVTMDTDFGEVTTGVKGLKIVEGSNGCFVAMANRKKAKGGYKDIAFPIDKETREQIQNVVLSEYERKLQEQSTKEDISSDLPF